MLLARDFRYVSDSDYLSFRGEASQQSRSSLFMRFHQAHADLSQTEARSQFDRQYPQGFAGFVDAFSPDGAYGAWLRNAVAVIKINDSLFVHGGLSSDLFEKSIDEINQTVQSVHEYQNTLASLIERDALSPLVPFQEREDWLKQNKLT